MLNFMRMFVSFLTMLSDFMIAKRVLLKSPAFVYHLAGLNVKSAEFFDSICNVS